MLNREEKEWLERDGNKYNAMEIQIIFILKRHNPRMPMEYHAAMLKQIEADLNPYFIERGKENVK